MIFRKLMELAALMRRCAACLSAVPHPQSATRDAGRMPVRPMAISPSLLVHRWMRTARFGAAALVLMTMAAAAPNAQTLGPDLITNGGFEDSNGIGRGRTAADWGVVGPGGGIHAGGRADSGRYYPIGGWQANPGGSIYQDVTLIPGATYRLRFHSGFFLARPSTGTVTAESATGDQTVITISTSSSVHSFREVEFVANDADTRIRFTFASGQNNWDIDSVSLRQVLPRVNVSSALNGAIADGGQDAQSDRAVGVAHTVTYTVTNSGPSALVLTGTPTVANLVNVAAPVTVTAPATRNLAPGETTTFDVTYTPVAEGAFSFDIDVTSDDPVASPYDIHVAGNGNRSPTVTLTGPAGPQTGPFTVTATFSEPVTGLTLDDFTITNGTASEFSSDSATVFTMLVTPAAAGAGVSVLLPADTVADADGVMNAASNLLDISSGALANHQREEIRRTIEQETIRDLRTGMQAHQAANRNARARLAASIRCRSFAPSDSADDARAADCADGGVSRASTPLSFTGRLSADATRADLVGRFESERLGQDAQSRRLFFTDVDVTRFDDGDVTASLIGRVAWERALGEDVRFGYFLGGSLRQSNLEGAFSGDRLGLNANTGAYVVGAFSKTLFWDGFASFDFGQNEVFLDDATAAVDGDYQTYSVQLGFAVSGDQNFRHFALRPELNLAFGYAEISNTSLDVTVGASTLEDQLDLDAVALGRVSFEPEFVVPFGSLGRVYDVSALHLTPSATCEFVISGSSAEDCGGGIALGWRARSRDHRHQVSVELSHENLGGITRESIAFLLESTF